MMTDSGKEIEDAGRFGGSMTGLGVDAPKPFGLLLDQIQQSSSPNISFYFMLGMSASIASFGLLSNSAPAIIGAMIVAPLMSPIIGLSFGSLAGDRGLILKSAIAVITGAVFVISIAFACTLGLGLRVVGSEILARTAPSTLDLLIALCSGAAAAYAHSRASIGNSIAGVAIAVALVPPLSVCGIGLALGANAVSSEAIALSDLHHRGNGLDMAQGAFLLFFTNLLGIVAASMLVFGLQNYGSWRKPFAAAAALVVASFFVVDMLDRRLEILFVEDLVKRLYVQAVEGDTGIVSDDAYIWQVRGERINDQINVSIVMLGLRENLHRVDTAAKKFQELISQEVGEQVKLRLEIIPIDVVTHEVAAP